MPWSENGDPAVRRIAPHLPRKVMLKLTSFIATKLDEPALVLTRALRKLNDDWKNEDWALELRATALVVANLIEQGWTVTPEEDRILFVPPGIRTGDETTEEAKCRLREALRVGR